jgi:integrase
METLNETSAVTASRRPWNKNKLIGPKPPLQPKRVWAIRTRLQLAGRTRDLALFNVAIDSKLRGCDVVSLKVEDVAPYGYAVDRATVRQSKTGFPVRFEITEQTRQAVDEHLAASRKRPGNFLFHSRRAMGAASRPASMLACCRGGSPQHRPRRVVVRHPLAQGHQGDVDLSANRKPPGSSTPPRAHQGGEHGQVPRH